MSDDVLITVENASKRFCRRLRRSLWYGLQDLGSELGGRRHGGGTAPPRSSADVALRPDEFWAVKDVSFELRRGECLGLIGRNGAGKTTLLRMLNGLIKPDTGRIEMRGNVGALIALGAGFNPVLTGRENIYVNAGILGYSAADTARKLDEVIDFSGVREFIDAPVQSYSSGMQVRLGFAVAAVMLRPDIVLLDEVLAVGDAAFQVKCINTVKALLKEGIACIFVSHNIHDLLRYCTKGLYMSPEGKSLGDIESVLSRYLQATASPTDISDGTRTEVLFGDEVCVQEIACTMVPHDGRQRLVVTLTIACTLPEARMNCEIVLQDAHAGINVLAHQSGPLSTDASAGTWQYRAEWADVPIRSTTLSIGACIWNERTGKAVAWSKNHHIRIEGVAANGLLVSAPASTSFVRLP